MRRLLIVVLAAMACRPAAAQKKGFEQVEIKATPVRGMVYMLEGSGGNIGVSVGADGILIVDDQFAPLADKIKAALKKLGEGKLRFVLNTHWHGDHTGGNKAMADDGATIIAHDNVRKRLSSPQQLAGRQVEPTPKEALPLITFDASLTVYFNDEQIRALHFPHGHTDGDSVIFFPKANVVHMGDDFFNGMFPFVDLDSGGDVEELTKNVGRIIGILTPDVKIIPGHGPLATLDDLKKFHRMLMETMDVVRKGIAAGKTLEELQKAGMPEEWKSWGEGFIKTPKWIEIVHRSLTKEKGGAKPAK